MADLAELFERNRAWAAEMVAGDPEFFTALAEHQSPEYPWIGGLLRDLGLSIASAETA